MKNWKQWTLVAIIAFFGIVVSFIACDNDNGTEQPQNWSATSLALFGGRTATIQGTGLTQTEWNNARTAIANKINTAYNSPPEAKQAVYDDVFNYGVNIIVEKIPIGYVNYKASDYTLNVYYSGINNLDVDDVVLAFINPETTIDGNP